MRRPGVRNLACARCGRKTMSRTAAEAQGYSVALRVRCRTCGTLHSEETRPALEVLVDLLCEVDHSLHRDWGERSKR